MKTQSTSVNITVNELETVIGSLKDVRDKMPFLVTLTPTERRLTRLSPDALPLAEASLAAAREHRNVLPQSFDFEAFENDVGAARGLDKCLTLVKQLASDLQDTLQTVGTEARKGSQQVRAHIKAVAKTTPGLQLAAESLTRRPVRGAAKDTNAQPAAPPASTTTPPPAPSPSPPAGSTPESKAA